MISTVVFITSLVSNTSYSSILQRPDLDVVTTGWFGTDFGIARSPDLLNWTLHATIPTNTTFTPVNSWAPEWFLDPVTNTANIVISLSTGSYGPFTPYIYTATDDKLNNFTDPVAITGIPSDGLGYIDTFPFYYKCVERFSTVQRIDWNLYSGTYHVFAKSETSTKFIEHAIADKLEGPYTFVQTGDFAGWGRAEGPAVVQLANGTFRLCVALSFFFPLIRARSWSNHTRWADGFDSGKYIYSDSPDLYNWSPYQNVADGLSGFIRHGTVLRQW
jgi:hypothetical protein